MHHFLKKMFAFFLLIDYLIISCVFLVSQISECSELKKGEGHVIPCLVDNKEKVTDESCKLFLKKMASIVFADYRLIYKFAEKCQADIYKLKCGRLSTEAEDVSLYLTFINNYK